MAEKKLFALFNTGKRRYALDKGGDGKDRFLEPGKSRSDLTEIEFGRLKRYPDLIDPSKIAPGAENAMASLQAENKALAKRVAELEKENAALAKKEGGAGGDESKK